MIAFNLISTTIKHNRRSTMKFIDIGANLTDTMYSGEYNGSSKHPPDLESVLQRAKSAGVVKMMVTGGNLEESRKAIDLAKSHPEILSATVGCHPTRCGEFSSHPGGGQGILRQPFGAHQQQQGAGGGGGGVRARLRPNQVL